MKHTLTLLLLVTALLGTTACADDGQGNPSVDSNVSDTEVQVPAPVPT